EGGEPRPTAGMAGKGRRRSRQSWEDWGTKMNEAIASLHWYQQGYWPLIGAMAGLVFTNLAGMAAIAYQSHRAHMNYLRSNAIDLLHRRLNEFYDPLYSLLLTNSRTFREVGPQSFPDDHIR